jgi:hypothetical protein
VRISNIDWKWKVFRLSGLELDEINKIMIIKILSSLFIKIAFLKCLKRDRFYIEREEQLLCFFFK